MRRYVLGLDGGGTKTLAAAQDEEGRELFRLAGGSLNPNGESPAAVRATLAQLLADAQAQAGPGLALGAVCVGAAGVSNPAARALVQEGLAQAVEEALGVRGMDGLVGYVYAPGRPKKDIAALAKLLPEAARAEDAAALAIYDRAARELALLAHAVAVQLGAGGKLALAGSALQKDERLRAGDVERANARERGVKGYAGKNPGCGKIRPADGGRPRRGGGHGLAVGALRGGGGAGPWLF